MLFFSAAAAGAAALTLWPFRRALACLKAAFFRSLRYLVCLSVDLILLNTRLWPAALLNETRVKLLAGLLRPKTFSFKEYYSRTCGRFSKVFQMIPDWLRVTKTTPFLSLAAVTPTVFWWTRPLKRYEFLPFRLLGSFFFNFVFQFKWKFTITQIKLTVENVWLWAPLTMNEELFLIKSHCKCDEAISKLVFSFF